jgi:hypothetical protein
MCLQTLKHLMFPHGNIKDDDIIYVAMCKIQAS